MRITANACLERLAAAQARPRGAGSRQACSFLESVARVGCAKMDTDPSASADSYTYKAAWPVYGVSLARRRVSRLRLGCLWSGWSSL